MPAPRGSIDGFGRVFAESETRARRHERPTWRGSLDSIPRRTPFRKSLVRPAACCDDWYRCGRIQRYQPRRHPICLRDLDLAPAPSNRIGLLATAYYRHVRPCLRDDRPGHRRSLWRRPPGRARNSTRPPPRRHHFSTRPDVPGDDVTCLSVSARRPGAVPPALLGKRRELARPSCQGGSLGTAGPRHVTGGASARRGERGVGRVATRRRRRPRRGACVAPTSSLLGLLAKIKV